MSADSILLTRDGATRIVTFNRPERFNAIDPALNERFGEVLDELETDTAARVVVLTGAGKAFCAGLDLTQLREAPADLRIDEHLRETFNRHALRLRALPMPTIAAVNGVAAGAGASFALAADIRIVDAHASFVQAFVRIALVPDTGSTWFLPQLVGLGRALELAMTGRPVDAEEAVRIGMANEVAAAGASLERALEVAGMIALLPQQAVALTKQAVYAAADGASLADSLELEAVLQQQAAQSADHREGLAAFFEKRTPQFAGV